MIAITGANGLLGRFILAGYKEQGLPVRAVVRNRGSLQTDFDVEIKEADILNPLALTDAFQGASVIIHAAALVSYNPRDRKKIVDANVVGTQNAINAALRAGASKFIHVSSVAALPKPRGIQSINENTFVQSPDFNSDYAESKYLAELEVYRGHEEGLRVSLVNPSVILAPVKEIRSSARLFKYVWDEKSFYTEGLVNYVDVRDVVNIIMRMADGDYDGERFIANGGTTTYRELFQQIAQRFGKKPPAWQAKPWVIPFAAGWERVASALTGREPLVTIPSLRSSFAQIHYNATKSTQELGITYRSLSETLDFCCPSYLGTFTTNN